VAELAAAEQLISANSFGAAPKNTQQTG